MLLKLHLIPDNIQIMIHLYNVTICVTYHILCTSVHFNKVWQNLHECTFALHDMHMHTYAKSYDNVHVDDHQQTFVNKFELQSNFDHRSDHLSNYKLCIF